MWDAIDRKLDKELEEKNNYKKRLSNKDSRFNLEKNNVNKYFITIFNFNCFYVNSFDHFS